MLYEFRTYEPHDGKAAALRLRFEREVMRVAARHGIEIVGLFSVEPNDGRLCYITRFADEKARQAAWNKFLSDEDWQAIKVASEADGPLLKAQSTLVLTAASLGLPLE